MAKTKGIDHSEAEVKKWVKEVLNKYNVYYFMPVQTGYGAAGLDFHCVVKAGKFPYAFFIETKEFGKEPTERQDLFIRERKKHQNAKTFVIDGMVGVNELEEWLATLRATERKRDGHS